MDDFEERNAVFISNGWIINVVSNVNPNKYYKVGYEKIDNDVRIII